MFPTQHKTKLKVSVKFILPSAYAVNLDQSINLLFGKELKMVIQLIYISSIAEDNFLMHYPFPKRGILDSSKLKEFADDNFELNRNDRKFSKRVENTVGKGKIAHYKQFLLFSVYSKDLYCRHIKTRACLVKG